MTGRIAACHFARSLIGRILEIADTKTNFTGVPADADYAMAVAWAVENGVATGTSETAFSPDTTCTRGHIVTFLSRAFA